MLVAAYKDIFLILEIVVQGGLRYVEAIREIVHRSLPVAMLKKEVCCCLEQHLAFQFRFSLANLKRLPWLACTTLHNFHRRYLRRFSALGAVLIFAIHNFKALSE